MKNRKWNRELFYCVVDKNSQESRIFCRHNKKKRKRKHRKDGMQCHFRWVIKVLFTVCVMFDMFGVHQTFNEHIFYLFKLIWQCQISSEIKVCKMYSVVTILATVFEWTWKLRANIYIYTFQESRIVYIIHCTVTGD